MGRIAYNETTNGDNFKCISNTKLWSARLNQKYRIYLADKGQESYEILGDTTHIKQKKYLYQTKTFYNKHNIHTTHRLNKR